jgi:DNA-directed RNA polymerase beta' subunit
LSVVSHRDYEKGILIGGTSKKQKVNYDSVNDPRLGAAVFNDDNCPTCNSDFKECMGHFGKVKLQQPMLNPIFKDRLQHVL